MEFNNGVQAGVSFEEAKKYPEPKFLHDRFENGESFIEFRMRIEGIFSKIMIENTYDRIAIVAHGGVINSLLRAFFKMPISMDYYFKMGDTGISLIEIEGEQKRCISLMIRIIWTGCKDLCTKLYFSMLTVRY